jgi:hypothetical protein
LAPDPELEFEPMFGHECPEGFVEDFDGVDGLVVVFGVVVVLVVVGVVVVDCVAVVPELGAAAAVAMPAMAPPLASTPATTPAFTRFPLIMHEPPAFDHAVRSMIGPSAKALGTAPVGRT